MRRSSKEGKEVFSRVQNFDLFEVNSRKGKDKGREVGPPVSLFVNSKLAIISASRRALHKLVF